MLSVLLLIYGISVFVVLALIAVLLQVVGIDFLRTELQVMSDENTLKLVDKMSNKLLISIMVLIAFVPILNTYIACKTCL